MRLPFKVLLLAVSIVLGLTLVTWTGSFLYWHIRITRALSVWEREAGSGHLWNMWRESGAPLESFRVIEAAGSRALPYLMGALERSNKRAFQDGLIDRFIQILAGPIPRNREAVRVLNERYEQWAFENRDTPDLQRAKCARAREWWRMNGHEIHPWWRVWSSDCRSVQ